MTQFPSLDYNSETDVGMRQFELLETDSYNLRYIKIQKKKRQYRSFITRVTGCTGPEADAHPLSQNITKFIYGNGNLVWQHIFAMRQVLPTAGWFINYKDELPPIIQYKLKYDTYTNDIAAKMTHGHLKLQAMIKEKTFAGVSELTGIPMATLKNMFRFVQSAYGYKKFHSLPNYANMQLLSNFGINPQLWFIMEDEKIKEK